MSLEPRSRWGPTFLLAVAAFCSIPEAVPAAEVPTIPPPAAAPLAPEDPLLVRLVREAEYHSVRLREARSLDEAKLAAQMALRAYEQALEAGAGSPRVLNPMAELYLTTGNPQRAIELMQRSLAEKPGQLPLYSGLNEAFFAMGQVDSATHYVEQALSLAPTNPDVRTRLAFLSMERGDWTAARNQLDSALTFDDHSAQAHRFLALWYSHGDHADSAIASYKRVVELSPDDVESHNNIAFLLAQQQRYAEALEWYAETKKLSDDPNLLHSVNVNMEAIRAIMDGKMRARFILVDDEVQGRDILRRLQAGEDFGELAAGHSRAPNARDGGDLGFFGPGDMLPEVEENVLRLKVGEVSPLIRIERGYMLLQRLN